MPNANRWLTWKPENAPAPQLAGGKSGRNSSERENVTILPLLPPATCHLLPGTAIEASGRFTSETPATWEPSPELPLQDHTFWADDFGKWALKQCLFSDRYFGGIKALHSDFCDWCNRHGEGAGPMLPTFEALLESEGFLLAGGLVSGLMLREDVEALTPRISLVKAGKR